MTTVTAEAAKELREEEMRLRLFLRSLVGAGLGSAVLFFLYVLILAIANSLDHALEEFARLWYWITPLVVGFGIQVGLYTYIRGGLRLKARTGAAASSVAVAGGVSTTSMAACCAHHVTDVLPIIGASAAAVLLNRYQDIFMTVGLLSNLIGINVMLRIIQAHGLHQGRGFLGFLMRADMKKSLYVVSTLSAAVFAAAVYMKI